MAVHVEASRRFAGIRTWHRGSRVVSTPDWHSLVDVRMLDSCRSALQRLGGDAVTSIGVTSTVRGEGRSSIALAFAALGQIDRGRSSVVVDMDLQAASLARMLGVADAPGVADIAQGEGTTLDDALQRIDDRIWLLPAGRVAGISARVMNRVVEGHLISSLTERFDLVVADMPPLLEDGLGITASRLIDTIVLVARAGKTPIPAIAHASELLATPPAVILNAVSTKLPRFARRLAGDPA